MNNTTENKLCYSVQEMAAVLGIGKNKAYDLINREGFPAVKLNGRYVIPVDALKHWLDEQAGA